MNQVDPEQLRQAAALMSLCGAPHKVDGVNSQARNCHLSSEGDQKLHLRFTDGELAQMIAMPLSGEPVAWSGIFRTRRTRAICSRLGTACRPSATTTTGSRHVTIGPTSEGGIQVSGGGFSGRFPGEAMANPFPSFPTPTDPESWTTVPYQDLLEALEFLTRGARKGKAGDRPTYTCLYADEVGMADQQSGFLLHYAPPLGFDAIVQLTVARRVKKWLTLVKSGRASQSPSLEAARFEWMGIPYACLRADGDRRMLCFPMSSEVFNRAVIDESRARPVAVIGVTERRELASFAAIASAMYRSAGLTISARAHGAGWLLDVAWDAGPGATSLKTSFPLVPPNRVIHGATLAAAGGPEPTRFRVAAAALLTALGRFTGKRILLTYRPSGGLLGIQSWSEHHVRQEWYTEPEAFILARQANPDATPAPPARTEGEPEPDADSPREATDPTAAADASAQVVGSSRAHSAEPQGASG